MAKYGSIVTEIGKQKITKAVLEGTKINMVEFAAGDGGGSYYQPTEQQIALKGEKWRGSIQECKANPESPNLIEIIAVIPPDQGGFTIREIGAFDSSGNLIVVANTPDTEKVIITTGAAGEVRLIIYMEISNAEVIELKIDPYTVSATKADLEAHDKSPEAHAGQFADKGQFVSHVENKDIHVTKEQKTEWADAAEKASKNEKALQGFGVSLSEVKGQLQRLEDSVFNEITGNPFTVSFKDLEGIKLEKGNYNKIKNQIEC